MFVIIGAVLVIASVLGGFVMHEGPLLVLLQWNEFIIIGGAAIGSLLISTPQRILKQLVNSVMGILAGDKYTREEYINLLKMMFELFHLATREGLINIEQHVEHPENSSIFSKNQFFLKNHHAVEFLCDTMKLMISGGVPPHDVEALLDSDIDTHHVESAAPSMLVQKTGDALPGLGIVAAVLGIIVTMQAISGPPEEIGMKVAAALVGTFIGILMSYGYLNPMATNMELLAQSESRYYECIKAGVVAFAKGNAPIMSVEFARRVIFSDMRPSFTEVEKAVKGK